jgi:hypothetical protein
MIWQPRKGQRVKLVYRKGSPAGMLKFAGCVGVVVKAARGPGPRNAQVLLDPAPAGFSVVVPRGNLVIEKE